MHIRRMREPDLTGSAADATLPKDGVQVVARPFTGKPAGVLIVEVKTPIASFIDAVLGISGFRVVGIVGSGPEDLFLARETRLWRLSISCRRIARRHTRRSGRCTLDAALRATIYCVLIRSELTGPEPQKTGTARQARSVAPLGSAPR